jgi:hypothetical protein
MKSLLAILGICKAVSLHENIISYADSPIIDISLSKQHVKRQGYPTSLGQHKNADEMFQRDVGLKNIDNV